jgi:uncharacterized protein YdaU (DUF1376 family)
MSTRPWYKRFPGDFLGGTLHLSFEERGAYSLVLDLIYDRGGPVADDAQYLARFLGISVRKWKAIRDRLIAEGKLYAEGGVLGNRRADRETESNRNEGRMRSKNGADGAAARWSPSGDVAEKCPETRSKSAPKLARKEQGKKTEISPTFNENNELENVGPSCGPIAVSETQRLREDRESCSSVCWTRDSENSLASTDDLERVPFPPRPPPPGADPGSARTPSSEETARAVALVSAAKEGFKSAGLASNPTPSPRELGAARSWAQAGADPDLTRMVAERIGAKFVARGEPVAPSLAYLNNPIREALTAPLAPVGASRHEPNRPPVDRHLARTREALDAIDAIGARRMEAERGASRRTDPG